MLIEQALSKRRLFEIVRTQGLSHRASKFIVNFMINIIKTRGKKELVTYLKELNVELTSRARYSGPSRFKRILFSVRKRGREGLTKALRLTNLAYLFTAPPATEEDFKAFRENVAKRTEVSADLSFSKSDKCLLQRLGQKCKFTTTYLLPQKQYVAKDVVGNISTEESIMILRNAPSILQEFKTFISSSLFDTESTDDDPIQYLLTSRSTEMEDKDIVGQIECLTKDGAYKHRFIANLANIHQFLISPGADFYKNFLKRKRMSALFTQKQAVEWIIEQIKSGRKITSVDLVQATDNLPFALFKHAMEEILCLDISETLKLSIRYDYKLCSSFYHAGEGLAVYNTGQAMGRCTSKYQLDISMILLAEAAGADHTNCRINGDDIVFADTDVANKYLELLRKYKVPISASKTFLNKPFGLFSGRLADRYGTLDVYRSKYPKDFARDPLYYLRCFGIAGSRLYGTQEQKAKALFIACLPGNYGLPNIRRNMKSVSVLLEDMDFEPKSIPLDFTMNKQDPIAIGSAFRKKIFKESVEFLSALMFIKERLARKPKSDYETQGYHESEVGYLASKIHMRLEKGYQLYVSGRDGLPTNVRDLTALVCQEPDFHFIPPHRVLAFRRILLNAILITERELKSSIRDLETSSRYTLVSKLKKSHLYGSYYRTDVRVFLEHLRQDHVEEFIFGSVKDIKLPYSVPTNAEKHASIKQVTQADSIWKKIVRAVEKLFSR